jgi:uncharacterized circularly permuted ATP-grasp superfamily protein/uncharacterized alpha-E superfamily protein
MFMNDTSRAPKPPSAETWHYSPLAGHWDEALLPSGFPRRHWRRLAVALRQMGLRQLARYGQSSAEIVREPAGAGSEGSEAWSRERPSPLDPIPQVVPENEWWQIEKAVAQRATLLNAMLRDLYGPQRLLYDHHLPPALVLSNPRFLRPCFQIAPAGGVHLHSYAADLGRSPDGHWWVLADRTQAPGGLGSTLENRLASARTLSAVFSRYHVRALARFFDVRRDTLLALAAKRSKSPRAVVFTPGPHSDAYFEHSFLAGYWGFPLVEGDDLAVREGRVHLKTLAGLQPVDVIIRCLDDDFCDPLELRADSLLGASGLVQAARNGAVVMDNALGSGLLEGGAYSAFLPGLCRLLLGEDLHLPAVATWWCGETPACQYVLEHLPALAVRPAFPAFGQQRHLPASMTEGERADLAERIKAHPERYVAQEGLALSTAPAPANGGVGARPVILRVFAAWDGESYAVMPGGLTRVVTDPIAYGSSSAVDIASKDTWVLGGAEEPAPRPAPISVEVYSGPGALPSRVADNLFWLGRYSERAEASVRLLRTLLPALSPEEDFGRAVTLETALNLLAALHYLPAQDAASSIAEQRWQLQRLLSDITYDPTWHFSLAWNLKEMHRVARQLKERLSSDTWRVLQQLEMDFARPLPVDPEQRFMAQLAVLDRAVITLSAFSGLLMENTTRGAGWRFLEIGRRLERALQMADLLRAGIAGTPGEAEPYLEILLQVADSSITYRTRYLNVYRTDLVLQLLLLDELNPRSVAFQLSALIHQLDLLDEQDEAARRRMEGLAAKTLGEVCVALIEDLAYRDGEGHFAALDALVRQLRANLFEMSESLTVQYLSPAKASRLTSSW